MKWRIHASQPLIGLEILSSGLRLALLRKFKQGYLLDYVLTIQFPPELVIEGKIQDWPLLTGLLREQVQALGWKTLPAAITLAANSVRMRKLSLPAGLPKSIVEAELVAQLQRDFAPATGGIAFDYYISASASHGYNDIAYAATPEAYLRQYEAAVNASGLQVKIADVDIYALQRIVRHALPIMQLGELNAIIYVTQQVAALMVYNTQEMLFHACWQMRDKVDFFNQLQQSMQVCHASLQKSVVTRLAICGAGQYLELIADKVRQPSVYQICYPNLFAQMQLGAGVQARLTPENAAEYFVACGAAMRELPKW